MRRRHIIITLVARVSARGKKQFRGMRGICATLGLSAGLLFIVGCNQPGAPGRSTESAGFGGSSSQTLRVHLSGEPASLDPALAEDGLSIRLLSTLMEGLVGTDQVGRAVPAAAKNWTESEGHDEFRFNLREDLKWSDGAEVTAAQFRDGLVRSLDPTLPSQLIDFFKVILGYDKVRARWQTLGSKPPSDDPVWQMFGVTTEGRSVVFRLSRSVPYFPLLLTLMVSYPVRDGGWRADSPTNGPYRIERHDFDHRYVLSRNNHYRTPVPLEKLEFVVVSDESTAMRLFEQGGLDILSRVPPQDLARFRAQGLLVTEPFPATYYLGFQVKRSPFQDVRLRCAASAAIGREALVSVLGGGEKPALGWIPDGIEGYRSTVPATAQAGAGGRAGLRSGLRSGPGAGGVKVDLPRVGGVAPKARIPLLYDATSRNQLILEKVQFDLRRKLGLNIELVGQDWKSLLRQLKTDPGPFFRFAWLAPFQDPITHLEVFRGGGRNNYTGWSNPRYDILLDEIATLPSGLARQKKIEEAQSILVDRECVIAPLFHYVQVFAVSRRVRGFVAKHNGAIDFSQVTLHSGHTGDTERAGQPGSQN